MTAVYVVEQNSTILKEGERLLIKKEGKILHTIHMFKLDQLVLFGNVSITPPAITYLLKEGIDTVFMTKHGRYKGRLQGLISKNITLRKEQFLKLSDSHFSLKTAVFIINGKLNNLRSVLLRINRSRKDLRLDNFILRLRNLQRDISSAKDIEKLRGIEGRGSAVYFEAFSHCIKPMDIKFRKRLRRPPPDPVNALLSLGYTFLFNEVLSAISMIGMDPYLGALHSIEYGRPSLALDLMEEWRPILIDTLVLSLFNLNTITKKDFEISKEYYEIPDFELPDETDEKRQEDMLPVKLRPEGMKKFITQFERKMAQKITYHLNGQQLSYRDCIREQIRHFARYIRGEDREYSPIIIR